MTLKTLTIAAASSLVLILGLGAVLFSPTATAQPGGQDIGEMLIAGLQRTEGCIRVDTAQTQSGRNCIFAWFENKEAVVRWYYSETHSGAMSAIMGATPGQGHTPLEHVPDDSGPIMVIASLIFTAENKVEGVDLPVSAISIELYSPLPAGATFGSSFGPIEIYEHMKFSPLGADSPAE